MKKYTYELFNKYFKSYQQNVRIGITELIRASDTEILLVCLSEMNKILDIISGRLTSQLDIPHHNMFPTTKQFNMFLNNLSIDLDKLFVASGLIVNDAQNVIAYTSSERDSITNLLTEVQGKVYAAYAMTQKGINGITVIREDFNSEDAANIGSKETRNVMVDINLKRLSIKPKNNIPEKNRESINTTYIDCFHYDALDKSLNLYPNSEDLSHGSFWNIKGNTKGHFSDKVDMMSYKKRILQHKKDIKLSLSSCQFESVLTIDKDSNLEKRIEKRFADYKSIPEANILINRSVSINDSYITTKTELPKESKIKLRSPFNDAVLSTGCEIILNSDDNNNWPVLNTSDSYVKAFVNVNGSLISQSIGLTSMSNETIDEFGTTKSYSILFNQAIVPDILELVFSYNDGWGNIKYYMSEYSYIKNKTVNIDVILGDSISSKKQIFYKQSVSILVDSSINNEKTNAINVFNNNGAK